MELGGSILVKVAPNTSWIREETSARESPLAVREMMAENDRPVGVLWSKSQFWYTKVKFENSNESKAEPANEGMKLETRREPTTSAFW